VLVVTAIATIFIYRHHAFLVVIDPFKDSQPMWVIKTPAASAINSFDLGASD